MVIGVGISHVHSIVLHVWWSYSIALMLPWLQTCANIGRLVIFHIALMLLLPWLQMWIVVVAYLLVVIYSIAIMLLWLQVWWVIFHSFNVTVIMVTGMDCSGGVCIGGDILLDTSVQHGAQGAGCTRVDSTALPSCYHRWTTEGANRHSNCDTHDCWLHCRN